MRPSDRGKATASAMLRGECRRPAKERGGRKEQQQAMASQAAVGRKEQQQAMAMASQASSKEDESVEGVLKMKEAHAQQIQMMINTNVNEHALASQAAAFAREEEKAMARVNELLQWQEAQKSKGGPKSKCPVCVLM